jgi:hypothetical protein
MNIAIAEPGPVFDGVQLGFHHRPMPHIRQPLIACAYNKLTAGRVESDPDGGPIIPLGGAVTGLRASLAFQHAAG